VLLKFSKFELLQSTNDQQSKFNTIQQKVTNIAVVLVTAVGGSLFWMVSSINVLISYHIEIETNNKSYCLHNCSEGF